MSTKVDTFSLVETIQEGLGPYQFTPLVAQFIKFMLGNKYEGLVLIDAQGYVAFMDRYSERFFGLSPGGLLNKHINDLILDSPLLDVLKTGRPQIWQVKEVMGEKKIVSRLPIMQNNVLIGAAAKVITHELEEIENLTRTVRSLRAQISSYERDFLSKNRAYYTFNDILGISASINRAKERAIRLAATDSTILITGESGTGKELFAHSIHEASNRSKGPFIRVNCAAIPFNLAESELFGYVKGAFTGSNSAGQKGKFELASGGTIFLDEISSMPLGIQAMVLRVIQEREIQPLGSPEIKRVDFRIIAATNVDLQKLVRNGMFRNDLYYRLSAMPLHLDPLRERPEDISFLALSLIEGINQKLNGNVESITPEALETLTNYDWPGNVRELINVLEQSVLNSSPGSEIGFKALPDFLRNLHFYHQASYPGSIRSVTADAQRKAIEQALEVTKRNKRKAARLVGLSRSALYKKIRRLNISSST